MRCWGGELRAGGVLVLTGVGDHHVDAPVEGRASVAAALHQHVLARLPRVGLHAEALDVPGADKRSHQPRPPKRRTDSGVAGKTHPSVFPRSRPPTEYT